MNVERRPVSIQEVEGFDEVGAVGTAAVVTPVSKIQYQGKDFIFGDGENAGPVITSFYEELTQLQTGDIEDTFGWLEKIEV
jgi:branched-chain amino acid aminotransferase